MQKKYDFKALIQYICMVNVYFFTSKVQMMV